MAKKTYIGIDFGTTKTAVSMFIEGSNQPQTISLQYGNSEIPSLIALDRVTGKVVKWGKDLEEQLPSESICYRIFKLRAGLNDTYKHDCQNGETKDVTEQFFRKIYEAIKSHFNYVDLNSDKYQFIIGCPTEWGKARRTNFCESIKRAGFVHFELLDEPIAIANYHKWNNDIDFCNDHFLVFDFGGATMNVGVFLPHEGGLEIIAVDGLEIGGGDFDELIVNLNKEKNPDFVKLFNDEKNRLGAFRYAERLKIIFSEKTEKGDHTVAEQNWYGARLSLDKEEFENECMDLIQQIQVTVKKMLDDNNFDSDKIKKIVISGGTGRFYFVRPELKEIFPHLLDMEIILSPGVNLVVAAGLAMSKHLKDKKPITVNPSPQQQPESTETKFYLLQKHRTKLVAGAVVLLLLMLIIFFRGSNVPPKEPTSNLSSEPVPMIDGSDCWEECNGGLWGCWSHHAGGFVKVTNTGSAGNICVTLEILMEKDGEWVVVGSKSIEASFNAGQSKHFEFSGSQKVAISDCPKMHDIKSHPIVSVP